MHHHVEGVDDLPAALLPALDPDDALPRGVDDLLQLNAQRPQMRLGGGGRDDQVIRDRGLRGDIKDADVTRLFVVEDAVTGAGQGERAGIGDVHALSR